jgi:hypothetical protein
MTNTFSRNLLRSADPDFDLLELELPAIIARRYFPDATPAELRTAAFAIGELIVGELPPHIGPGGRTIPGELGDDQVEDWLAGRGVRAILDSRRNHELMDAYRLADQKGQAT